MSFRTLNAAVIVVLLLSCNPNQTEVENKVGNENNSPITPNYQVIISEQSNGFGYQLLKDGKLIIDQPTIPAIQGNQSFSTREKAETTANYLIEKLKKGIFPPTLSVEELDSLAVLN